MAAGLGDTNAPWLVADIGGTNARFAIYDPTSQPAAVPLAAGRLKTADYPGPAECTRTFLHAHWKEQPISRAALAIAAPVTGDVVSLTNADWRFSIQQLRQDLALNHLEVINDFAALAHALPLLEKDDRVSLGPERPAEKGQPMVVIGPGTGLGAAAVLPHENHGWAVVAVEGGHTTAAARCDREAAVLAHLRRENRHVSYERVASGPGLLELSRAIAEIEGAPFSYRTPAEVAAGARNGEATCREALALFQGFLANFAGDMALIIGARGGIYLGGGVLAHLEGLFDPDAFRARMEDKGRFRDYPERIPLWQLRRQDAAFLGLRRLLSEKAENDAAAP